MYVPQCALLKHASPYSLVADDVDKVHSMRTGYGDRRGHRIGPGRVLNGQEATNLPSYLAGEVMLGRALNAIYCPCRQ